VIASLRGVVESLENDAAVVNVGGIGFRVHAPSSLLSTLGAVGEEVRLYTHLHVKEDGISLYGFASVDELRLFETLIGVSGLGPRLALAMLSAMKAEQLAMAIATGSTQLLTTVPGIGRKMAERVVLELKDRMGAGLVAAPEGGVPAQHAEVLAALTSLGYSVTEASRAVASLPHSDSLSLEDQIRLALRYLGGK